MKYFNLVILFIIFIICTSCPTYISVSAGLYYLISVYYYIPVYNTSTCVMYVYRSTCTNGSIYKAGIVFYCENVIYFIRTQLTISSTILFCKYY